MMAQVSPLIGQGGSAIVPSQNRCRCRRHLHCQSVSAACGLSVCGLEFASRGCAPLVAMLQTSHPRKGYHPSTRRRLRCDYPRLWCIFLQSQMTAIFVIVGEEFTHHSVKLRLVEDDDLVQQLSAQGSPKPLHIRIGIHRQLHPGRSVLLEWSGSRIRFILCLAGSTD